MNEFTVLGSVENNIFRKIWQSLNEGSNFHDLHQRKYSEVNDPIFDSLLRSLHFFSLNFQIFVSEIDP